ncbi:DUF6712 family protein [Flavobacterium capsici]|uniref:Uncharacterized protein n=1 Tax=Flavobacterium capsici TaxID=3075618 RepID=A0AA96JBI2_9FLAO|nr:MULTISPECIES: hypothetical protein [unclassified Flavobacterium]WNM18613.1 hypothetical protein RN608_11405 [Flavobacterium sp. PMR2A8]WNM22664.1 hypothetical protein RN605_04705 [Flavobacterium sp. PMTSA4]
MNQILTPSNLLDYKDIGQTANAISGDTKIISIIEEAQLTDLKDALGDKFYFDLLSNLDNPIYQDLLSGSTFNYCGVSYYQNGIKALLADYFMAKYILVVNTNLTGFGAVIKHNNNSEPVDRNSLKDYSNFQLKLASSKLEIIRYYLNSNTSKFPNWKNNSITGESTSNRRFRFRKL